MSRSLHRPYSRNSEFNELTLLQDERAFLLRSLKQLDCDHATGVLTHEEYRSLREEQTARAADVLRRLDAVQAEIEQKTTAKQSAEAMQKSEAHRKPAHSVSAHSVSENRALGNRRSARQRALWLVAAVVFVGVVGGSLAAAAKGDNRSAPTLLQAAQSDTSSGHAASAVKTYDQVLKKDPGNVEALAYKGWLLRLAGLPNEGLKSIEQAIAIDPKYPDAHFFRGFILWRDRQDPATATQEFQMFLNLNPPPQMIALAQQTLQQAKAEMAQQTATTTTTTAP